MVRARVSVVALHRVVIVLATKHRMAAIGRTDVSVVAIRRWAANARTALTSVIQRTSASVGTRVGVVSVHTTQERIARVRRADVTVVAVRSRTTNTRPTGARVVRRASVIVAAWIRVVRIHAPGGDVARIGRAHIAVITIRRRTTHARPIRAGVIRRAFILVIARIGVIHVLTTRDRMTRVCGADLIIIAIQHRSRHAGVRAQVARFHAVANIAVVAFRVGIAAIGHRRSGCALTAHTGFGPVAENSIAARRAV